MYTEATTNNASEHETLSMQGDLRFIYVMLLILQHLIYCFCFEFF